MPLKKNNLHLSLTDVMHHPNSRFGDINQTHTTVDSSLVKMLLF